MENLMSMTQPVQLYYFVTFSVELVELIKIIVSASSYYM